VTLTDPTAAPNDVSLAANVGTGEGSIHRACEERSTWKQKAWDALAELADAKARVVQLEAALQELQRRHQLLNGRPDPIIIEALSPRPSQPE
jgi:hypothetical protein